MRNTLLFLLLLCSPAVAHAEETLSTITVHGEATTKVAPDQVTLPVTIQEQNIDLKSAKERHDRKLAALLKLARDTGIEKDDTRTGYTSINPRYDYQQSSLPRVIGYDVQTSVNFTLHDIPTLGLFMNKVIDLGIPSLGNVEYSLRDEEKAKQETLAKAVANAYAKATKMAEAAHVSVEKPVDIEEGMPSVTRPFFPMASALKKSPMMATAMAAPPAELPSGMIEIRQDVTITYQIK